jgi:hypothetical protein
MRKAIVPLGLVVIIVAALLIYYGNKGTSKDSPPNENQPIADLINPILGIPIEFGLDEGYKFTLAPGWNLVSHHPERAVDRYRFAYEQTNTILTISYYGEDIGYTFNDVMDARFGGTDLFTLNEKPLEVSGFSGKYVELILDEPFAQDAILRLGENQFISLYGVFDPGAPEAKQRRDEIKLMQESFQAI